MRSFTRTVSFVLALPMSALAGGDFNGDGFDDAAIAAPFDPVLGGPTGAVSVIYGGTYGLSAFTSAPEQQLLTAFHFGLAPNLGDEFGLALAIGDFDGDGFGDLAIGIPGREVAGAKDAGAVGVVYGTSLGLDPERQQLWTQASRGIKDDPEAVDDAFGDGFGCALTAGDFNGDGRDDLAIGACGESVGANDEAGAVHVLRGSKTGLRAKKNQFWTREALGIEGDSGLMGSALARGDFDGDGFDDLAIGSWLTRTGETATGAVDVLFGSKKGLSATRKLLLEPLALFGGEPESFYFGAELAAGDFDANGAADLAIGAPGTNVSGLTSAGATHVVYGAPGTGLDVANLETWDEVAASTGDFGSYDQLGSALAAGDFDSDGRDDLAIGVPFASVDGLMSAGEAIVLRGGNGGLGVVGFQTWSQATLDVDGIEEAGDSFGYALASGDFDGDGAMDLLVGASRERVLGVAGAGAVNVLYGDEGGSGLTAEGNDVLARSEAIEGTAEVDARFGHAIGR